jgi:uncharacterized membrane protein YcfT
VAAALEIAPIHTGSVLIDEFASRFVYFYTGYVFAGYVFRLADEVRRDKWTALTGVALWATLNGLVVFNGYGDLPFVSLALGMAGALAIVAMATLLTDSLASVPLRWLGAHSIVVYLAFFLPMAVSRTVLLKLGIIPDVGTVSVLVTLAGITGPVVLYALVQWSGVGRFLFERPAWARIDRPYRRPREAMVPAE